MCGIGIIAGGSGGRREAALRAILKAHAHRGPDGDAVVMRDGVGFAHSRLAIIDLSAAAAEPMPNADGTAWLVVQRRDLQLQGAARRARRLPVPHAQRRRGAAGGLRAMGRGVPRSLQRDVRVRDLGRADPDAVCRPRSLRREAAVLRHGARRRARDRERNQGAARRRRAARAGRRGVGDVFRPRHVRPRRDDVLERRSSCAARVGPAMECGARTASSRAGTTWRRECSTPGRTSATRDDGHRRSVRAAREHRRAAVPVRRAGRAVRVRRAGLVAAARARGAHPPGCRLGERVHVLLRPSGLRRAPVD